MAEQLATGTVSCVNVPVCAPGPEWPSGGSSSTRIGWPAPVGCVYLLDIDVACFGLIPPDPDLHELHDRYQRWHADRGNDLRLGRRLPELAEAAGLVVEHR